MSRAELKAAAKSQIKGNIGKIFLCTLIIFGISLACGFIPEVGSIILLVITPAFSVGFCLIYLGLTEGKKAEIGTMFKGFQVIGKALWLNILIAIFTTLWSMLFVIPGLIKSYSYAMAYYVLADNPEMTAREALRESKEIMKGHKWELFVIHLSFILWNILATLTLGIAYIYVIPYMSATVANFYQKIKRQPEVVEVSVEEVPVEEVPVEEVPVEETPVEEVPVEEAPVEDVSAE